MPPLLQTGVGGMGGGARYNLLLIAFLTYCFLDKAVH